MYISQEAAGPRFRSFMAKVSFAMAIFWILDTFAWLAPSSFAVMD